MLVRVTEDMPNTLFVLRGSRGSGVVGNVVDPGQIVGNIYGKKPEAVNHIYFDIMMLTDMYTTLFPEAKT